MYYYNCNNNNNNNIVSVLEMCGDRNNRTFKSQIRWSNAASECYK